MADRNYWFQLSTYFPVPFEGETKLNISTIAPVAERDILYRFRHAILNRYVPYDTILKLNTLKIEKGTQSLKMSYEGASIRKAEIGEDVYNKIHAFFDWLDATDRPSWEDQNPTANNQRNVPPVSGNTRRWYYENKLPDETRLLAFQNTPLERLDEKVPNLSMAIYGGFETIGSPEGALYWANIIDKYSEPGNVPVSDTKKKSEGKTRRWWYETILPDKFRLDAFKNTETQYLDVYAKDLKDAICNGFNLSESPQGHEYWESVIEQVQTGRV